MADSIVYQFNFFEAKNGGISERIGKSGFLCVLFCALVLREARA